MKDRFTWGPGDVTVLDIDADRANADWARGTWDLWTPDHALVSTLAELRAAFGDDDDRLAHFLTLPAARAMPEHLRQQADGLLFHGTLTKMAVVKSGDLERLADLEHEQWMSWTRSLVDRGDVSGDLADRWRSLWRPYADLSEAEKDKDREWARRALTITKSDEATGIALAVRERLEKEFDPDQPRDETGKWTATGGIFDPKAPPPGAHRLGAQPENPLFGPALDRVIASVAKTNSKGWDEARIRSEMAKADAYVASTPSTLVTFQGLDRAGKDARLAERKVMARDLYGKGAPGGEHPRLDIWMGPSGAGKSTQETPFLKEHRAVRIDADIVKEHPLNKNVYKNGLGANALHEESSDIANHVYRRALNAHDNISMAVVGKTFSNADPRDPGMLERIQEAQARGYEVHLHLINAKPETSLRNTTQRFVENGRYVKGSYVFNGVDSKPVGTYVKLVNEAGGLLMSHEATNNDDRSSPKVYRPEAGETIP